MVGDVTQATQIAEGISNYGFMAMVAAFYLVITATMIVAIFKWFKGIINQTLGQNRDGLRNILEETRKQNNLLIDLAEGLRTETQLRLRNLSGFAFDLSVEQVCRLIKRVREENNIENRPATTKKVRLLLRNIHNDRNSRFDPFTYRGKCISAYCDEGWIEEVALIVEGELYNENGIDDKRAFSNVKAAYDDIKIKFYNNLNNR